jgi:hypothetical protein
MAPAESTTHSSDSSSNMVNFDDVAAWLKAYTHICVDVEPWMINNMVNSMHTDLVKQKLTKEQFEQQ